MTLPFVIIGVVSQACFALFSFMVVAFSAGMTLPGGFAGSLFERAITGIPATSLVVAVSTIVLYVCGASAKFYWLHAIPLILLAAYVVGLASHNDW